MKYRLPVDAGRGLLVTACIVLLLPGCSVFSDELPASGARSSAGDGQIQILVEKDKASWALPSDAYNPPYFAMEDYAIDLQATPCLEAAGIDFRMVRFDPNGPGPKTMNDSQHRIFNRDVAAEFGYHLQLDPRVSMEDRIRNDADSTLDDPDTWETWNNCRQDALRELGGDPTQEVYSFGFPVDSADRDPAVHEAEEKWRQCMAPLGIADLPSDATPTNGLPTDSQYEHWGLNQDVAPWEIPPPGQDEIKAAIHDAECRDSSGWTDARYEAEWNAEIDYLTRNYRELEAKRVKYDALKEAYLKVIRERG